MKESWSETLWNEEIRRRCGVVDIAEKVRKARLRRDECQRHHNRMNL
jgi:hypothetical protein